MNKSTDDRQIVMDIDMFRHLVAVGMNAKIEKHIRKFNPVLKAEHANAKKNEQLVYRTYRDKVLGLEDRKGKIVYLAGPMIEWIGGVRHKAPEYYEPMLLVGKDHNDKLSLRLKYVLSMGYYCRSTRSYHVSRINRLPPEGFVHWLDGPMKNKFTAYVENEFKYETQEQYLSHFAERIR